MSEAATQTDEKGIVEYTTNGQKIKLTTAIVRKFFCAEADDVSALAFAGFCRAHSLDPFAKDCFLSVYEGKATMTIAYQIFMRTGESCPAYQGFVAGTILQRLPDATIEMTGEPGIVPTPLVACPGEFVPDGYRVVGGWCRVNRSDRSQPFIATVRLEDYVQTVWDKQKGERRARKIWAEKEATMIRKTAIAHAFRDAFPASLGRWYIREEMPEAAGGAAPEKPTTVVVLPEILTPLFEALGMNRAQCEMFVSMRPGKPNIALLEELEQMILAKGKTIPAVATTVVVESPADVGRAGAAAMMQAATIEPTHETTKASHSAEPAQLALTDF